MLRKRSCGSASATRRRGSVSTLVDSIRSQASRTTSAWLRAPVFCSVECSWLRTVPALRPVAVAMPPTVLPALSRRSSSTSAGVMPNARASSAETRSGQTCSLVMASTLERPGPERHVLQMHHDQPVEPRGRSCTMPSPLVATARDLAQPRSQPVDLGGLERHRADRAARHRPEGDARGLVGSDHLPVSGEDQGRGPYLREEIVDPLRLGGLQLLEDLEHHGHLAREDRAGDLREPLRLGRAGFADLRIPAGDQLVEPLLADRRVEEVLDQIPGTDLCHEAYPWGDVRPICT